MTGFASALYLGLAHGSKELRPWRSLTAGAPAVLVPPAGSGRVARHLASLVGTEAATLAVSTLHLFWDLFGQIRRRPLRILADEHLYPVGRWGIERAAAAGVPASSFAHQDARSLARRLESGPRLPPLVVTDGLCPDCGRVPPLDRYLALVEEHRGWLLVDDSQALGLLGRNPGPGRPYGLGGGGSAAFRSILSPSSPRLLILSSLAKSFGAPLAVLAGSAERIGAFVEHSETLVFSSPPSVAAIRATEAALAINRERGDGLRDRLAERVIRFREGLRSLGLSPIGGLSPVQNLEIPAGLDPKAFRSLAILRQGKCRPGPLLTFLLRADHTPEEIDRAIQSIHDLTQDESDEQTTPRFDFFPSDPDLPQGPRPGIAHRRPAGGRRAGCVEQAEARAASPAGASAQAGGARPCTPRCEHQQEGAEPHHGQHQVTEERPRTNKEVKS